MVQTQWPRALDPAPTRNVGTRHGREYSLKVFAVLAACLAPIGMSDAAHAQTDDFYAGKTVTITIGFGPGGGYDSYARLAAQFLGEHIPGNPEVIVEYMPGAGGRRLVDYMVHAGESDGTAIALVPQAVAFDSVLGQMPQPIDAADLQYIGRLTRNVEVQVTWHTSETTSVEDAKTRETVVATTGPTGISGVTAEVMNALFDTEFLGVGYPGSADMALAVERGEAEGMTQSLAGLLSNYADWMENDQLNYLWQLSLERHPLLPEVPALVEFAETPEQEAVLRLLGSTAEIGRTLAVSPEVPDDRVAILRDAFDAMIEDPDFLAAAEDRSLPVESAPGQDIQAQVEETMQTPESALSIVREILAANAD